MSVTKALLLVAQLPALASSASINPYHIDYGYWNANVSVNNVRMTNTEFYSRVCIVSAEYWAYPGVINQWGTLHSNVISTIGFGQPASFDDTSFGANDVDGQGDQHSSDEAGLNTVGALIMWQTVTLNGVEYDIEGEAMVAMSCGEAPERLCTGSARVDAALRVPNGPAAPHIPATIISLGFSQETNTATPA